MEAREVVRTLKPQDSQMQQTTAPQRLLSATVGDPQHTTRMLHFLATNRADYSYTCASRADKHVARVFTDPVHHGATSTIAQSTHNRQQQQTTMMPTA